MNTPKISVVMSVYNGIPFLRKAVKSILSQSFRDFEFIIIDDASTDNSWEYLKSLKDKRLKLIKNEKNLGVANSLNKGIKEAKGDYIARMDADDISFPDRFEEQIKFLSKNPEVDICGAWVELINEDGKVIGKKIYPTENKQIKKALMWYQPIVHPTFLGKSEFFRDLNGYNPQFDMAEDYELLLRAKGKYKMANLPQILLKWRLWDNRRSRKSMDKMDKTDLRIKKEALEKGYFGPLYSLIVLLKFVTTYFIPLRLKIKFAKTQKLA